MAPDAQLVSTTRLMEAFPNPFNPVTVIRYSLPARGWVTLTIYDVLGREVARLVDELQDAGYRSVEWDAGSRPSGVYFYRLQAGAFVETKKLVLMR